MGSFSFLQLVRPRANRILGNFNSSGVGSDSGTRRVGVVFLPERSGLVAHGGGYGKDA